MTTLAFAHHAPGAHVLELIRGGGPVFGTFAEAMADVPTGKDVVQVAITTFGWRRYAVQGLESAGPFTDISGAIAAAAAAAAGLPLNAVQVYTAVNHEDTTHDSVMPLSACITSYAPVSTVHSFDDTILQPAIRELLGHQRVLGGAEPREVTRRLLDLWLTADSDTEAKLATAFPEMAWAIEKLQNNGLLELHKTIGYGA